ncbi:MAG: acetyl-CoA carboxylase biotin carboxyl carrier protein subunit [Chloroflexi bacterium]|nr:MAG: acetyl-CoA carboxylase biotin carboxyl carrier protein subunit [Chloroflexota bacterium]PIE80691.1 MAG: acetyl-CoA carboxylase biotin carboxyl carrier protein subunit [Chloroflexota bacterium]
MKYYTIVNEQEFVINIGKDNSVLINEQPYDIDFQILPISGLASLLINNQSLEAVVEKGEDYWQVLTKGELYYVNVLDERTYQLAQARGKELGDSGETAVKAPMPGLIIKVLVEAGEVIAKGQTVVILESMKMENELKAARDGVVTAVKSEAGASVEKDQVLVVIGDPEE